MLDQVVNGGDVGGALCYRGRLELAVQLLEDRVARLALQQAGGDQDASGREAGDGSSVADQQAAATWIDAQMKSVRLALLAAAVLVHAGLEDPPRARSSGRRND